MEGLVSLRQAVSHYYYYYYYETETEPRMCRPVLRVPRRRGVNLRVVFCLPHTVVPHMRGVLTIGGNFAFLMFLGQSTNRNDAVALELIKRYENIGSTCFVSYIII